MVDHVNLLSYIPPEHLEFSPEDYLTKIYIEKVMYLHDCANVIDFCIPELIFRILGHSRGEKGKSTICLGQIDRIGNKVNSICETIRRIVMHSNSST